MNAVRQKDAVPLSLAEQAYSSLEDKLVTLALPPGSMISEGDLIDMTGLGRTPVREALQKLAQQDFFRVLPRKGLLVTPVVRGNMLHILEARRPLENLIVYRAALNARDEQRSGLSAIARELTISYDRFEEFVRLDYALNDLLDTCSGNPYATAAVSPLRSHCRRFWYFYRDRMQLSDSISALSKMTRLVARREFKGAQKASDGLISVLERTVSNVDRLA
jgi:DNA-binding GntR family transcriptional regulator